MGITVLTALVVLRPSGNAAAGPGTQSDASSEPAAPGRPAFLDEPARVTMRRSTADTDAVPIPPPLNEPKAPDLGTGGLPTPSGRAPMSPVPGTGDPYAVAGVGGPPPASGPSAREQAFRAALVSSLLPSEQHQRSVGTQVDAAPSEEERLVSLGDSVLRAAMRPGGAGAPTGGASMTTTREPSPSALSRSGERRRAFLQAAGDSSGTTAIVRLEPAGSPHTLRAGTVVPAVLLTGINSDLPGELVAQVSRDVYDSRTQRVLLIPKGAKLIGTYDNQVAAGQNRLLVAWTRLILPDGRSMRLPGLALKDLQGQTGVGGRVDNHGRRVFGNALLLSAISAGLQLSQAQQGSILAAPSVGQVAAGAVGQELSQVALEILRRGVDTAPTITVPQGQPFNVFVNGDLVFDGPYEPTT
jgi:type IV secretion system protein VirB10